MKQDELIPLEQPALEVLISLEYACMRGDADTSHARARSLISRIRGAADDVEALDFDGEEKGYDDADSDGSDGDESVEHLSKSGASDTGARTWGSQRYYRNTRTAPRPGERAGQLRGCLSKKNKTEAQQIQTQRWPRRSPARPSRRGARAAAARMKKLYRSAARCARRRGPRHRPRAPAFS